MHSISAAAAAVPRESGERGASRADVLRCLNSRAVQQACAIFKRIHVASEGFLCPYSRPLSIVGGRRFTQVRPAPPALQNLRSGHPTLSPSKGPTFLRRAPNRNVPPPSCGDGPLGGLHSIRAAAGAVRGGERSEGVRADVLRCLNSHGAGSRQSPGFNVKRIHIVLRRRLLLKVPPAAPAVLPFLHSFRQQAISAGTAPSPVGTAEKACLESPRAS